MRGLLPVLVLMLGLHALPAAADAPRESRAQKIAQLTADLGYGEDTKHVGAAAPFLAADLAPADPGWNPSHRRWNAVIAAIRSSLREDANQAFGETEEALREAAQRALEDGVVGDDLDYALAFLRSSTGQHFLKLQGELTDLGIGISLEQDATAGGVTVENLDARRAIVDLWLPLVFIRALYSQPIAERNVDAAYQKLSKLRGAEIDALAARFAGDVPECATFVHSPAFARIIAAEKSAAQSSPAPNFAAFFAAEARRHGAEWRALYLAP